MELVIHRHRRPRGRRALNIVINVFCVLAVLGGLALLVPSLLGMQRYVITGTSMTGTIDYGSLVYEEVVPVDELEVGDIITYQPPPDSGVQELVTHRIVSVKHGQFRTQGDAVPKKDPWRFELAADEQSRVVYAVPYVGHAFIALQDRQTRIVLVTIPAALIALVSLARVAAVLLKRKSAGGAVPAGG